MIAVEAALQAESAAMRIVIRGSGNVITCRVDGSPASLLDAARQSPQLLAAIRTAIPLLTRTGLQLEIVIGRFAVARAGSGVSQNALARLLRLPSAHVGA
jgi:hypothetical protein